MNPAVELFLEDLPPRPRAFMRRLQALLLGLAPEVAESFKWKLPFYAYHGLLCYLNPRPDHVVVGFVRGAALAATPAGDLLTGTSKTVRHVVVRHEDDVFQPAFLALLEAALHLNAASRAA